MQDAAGTKNGKSDWYIPRYTKLNRVYTKIYLEKRRSIPRYTQLYPVNGCYTELNRVIPIRVILSITVTQYILWPKIYTELNLV